MIYEIGAVMLIIGKIMIDQSGQATPFLKLGAVVTLLGAIGMLCLFVFRRRA